MQSTVKILGARGSVPVSGAEFFRYGGATLCVLVRLEGQSVVLDAGTGLLRLSEALQPEEREIPLLLTHPHADHLLGLPLSPALLDPSLYIKIYTAPRNGLDGEAQVRRLMAPPLWPVGPEQLPAKVTFHPLSDSFSLGAVQVDCMEGAHPGGVTLFRLRGGGKTVVLATDCTLQGDLPGRVTEFARDCDLLLCDGQYSPEEWPAYEHFGHSTWEMAARLGECCGAKRTVIVHHAPDRTDEQLDAAAAALAERYPNCTFAREGEEITL